MLGIEREWPELFDVMCEIVHGRMDDKRHAEIGSRLDALASDAKRR